MAGRTRGKAGDEDAWVKGKQGLKLSHGVLQGPGKAASLVCLGSSVHSARDSQRLRTTYIVANLGDKKTPYTRARAGTWREANTGWRQGSEDGEGLTNLPATGPEGNRQAQSKLSSE